MCMKVKLVPTHPSFNRVSFQFKISPVGTALYQLAFAASPTHAHTHTHTHTHTQSPPLFLYHGAKHWCSSRQLKYQNNGSNENRGLVSPWWTRGCVCVSVWLLQPNLSLSMLALEVEALCWTPLSCTQRRDKVWLRFTWRQQEGALVN